MRDPGDISKSEKKLRFRPSLALAALLLLAVIGMAVTLFYRALEDETYAERTAYLTEISGQIAATADSAAFAQWDLAAIFSNRLHRRKR